MSDQPTDADTYGAALLRQRAAADPVSAAVSAFELLADALAPQLDVWGRMLRDHVPTDDRHCRRCTQGGTGSRLAPWPCALRVLAEHARDRHLTPGGGE